MRLFKKPTIHLILVASVLIALLPAKAFADADVDGQTQNYGENSGTRRTEQPAVALSLFIDSNYSTPLVDWPASGDYPRSPRYMFGENDPIYVELFGMQADPGVQETLNSIVKVTSESDTTGITLSLKETGVNTNVFRNDLALGELLYLSSSSEQGNGDKIKVLDEEVLTFAVDTGQGYVTFGTVKVDRAEAGVEWQSNYSTYDPTYGSILCADDFAQGFYNNIGTANLVWSKNFDNGDLESKESHFASGGDGAYADSVDIAVWCGHGIVNPTPYMRFFVDLVDGQKQEPDKLYWTEICWGNTDVDWLVANTCNFLNGTDAELKQMFAGLHLVLGYATDMTVFCEAGEYFAGRLEVEGIKAAWHRQCDQYQPTGNTSRVFGRTACMGESFATDGPVSVNRDSVSTSGYSHDDFTTQ
jgi:hypothetical protein